MAPYHEDLAFIHDAGYGDMARAAVPVVLDALRQSGLDRGLVIDLGCGSGILAAEVAAAGYDVLGFDISPAMVALARQRVPQGRFHARSFLAAEFPACVAVTAIGEVFNYLFDAGNTDASLGRLLRRIHDALAPGGMLLFDGAEPGRIPGGAQRAYRESDDWAVLVDADEDGRHLTRRITSFRKVGKLYRRDHEVHEQRLFRRADLARQLRQVGFRVRILRRYGARQFPAGYVGFLARKTESVHGRKAVSPPS